MAIEDAVCLAELIGQWSAIFEHGVPALRATRVTCDGAGADSSPAITGTILSRRRLEREVHARDLVGESEAAICSIASSWLYDGFAAARPGGGMSKHVAVLMGGWSSEREVSSLRREPARNALEKARLSRDPRRCRRAISLPCCTALEARCGAQRAARRGPARTARCRASSKSWASPTPIPGVMASSLAMQKDMAQVVMQAAGVPVPEARWCRASTAAKDRMLLERPYVHEAGGGGFERRCVHRHRATRHPPQELLPLGLEFGRPPAG